MSADGFVFAIRLFDGWTQGDDPIEDRYFDAEYELKYVHPKSHWQHKCEGYTNLDELIKLIHYLEQHVDELAVAGPEYDVLRYPHPKRKIFLTLGGGYSIHALIGERESDGTGCFTIRVLLDTGMGCRSRTNTSFGGESLIEIQAVSKFTSELRKFIDSLVPSGTPLRKPA